MAEQKAANLADSRVACSADARVEQLEPTWAVKWAANSAERSANKSGERLAARLAEYSAVLMVS